MKTLILFLVSSLFLSIMQKENNDSGLKAEFFMIEIREVVKDEKAVNSRLPVIIVKRD